MQETSGSVHADAQQRVQCVDYLPCSVPSLYSEMVQFKIVRGRRLHVAYHREARPSPNQNWNKPAALMLYLALGPFA